MHIEILNGPNLDMLGEREPEIYGATTLAEIEAACTARAQELGVEVTFRQSNYEGELIGWIHAARKTSDALMINPAGLSFQSVPLVDALKIFGRPIVELHLSNIHARDALHRHSIVSTVATAVICGLGADGYPIALDSAVVLAGRAAESGA